MKKAFKSVLAVLFCVLTLSATMVMASALNAPTAKVKSVAVNSVTLYWTKVSGADGYQIQRTTDAKNWTTVTSSVTATSYTDSKGLTTGVTYGYRVRAYDKGLIRTTYSAWTPMIKAKPVPSKVTGLKVKAANSTAVQLTWNKVSGASGYTVQYYSGGKWKTYKSTTSNSLVVSGLKLGSSYHFRVAAVKIVSKKWIYGTPSDYIKTGPILPATSKVVLSGVNASALKVQWAGVSGAKGFEIYNHNSGAWTDVGAKTSTIVSGLKSGTAYSFTVRAYAGSIKGTESKIVTFKTAPSVPANLKIADATDNSITFTWDVVEGAEGYQPAYYDYAAKKWTNLSLTTGTTATASKLNGLTTYAFRVRAYVKNANVYNINAYATSKWTGYITATTVLPSTTVSALKSTATTETKIQWTSIEGADGYCIEKYDTVSKDWNVFDFNSNTWKAYTSLSDDSVISTSALSFTDVGKATRSDLYRVTGIDANGVKGTASEPATAYTSDIAMNNTAATFNLQQIIAWPAVDNAVTYEVIARNPVISTETIATFEASKITKATGTCQATVYLAPDSIQSLMILCKDAKGQAYSATNWLTFKIGAVPMYSSDHKYYNASVNSQLLYLANSINKTKAYTGSISVSNKSEIAYSVDSLKIPILLVDKKTPEEVADFFKRFGGDSGDMPTSASEKFDVTLNFNNGSALNEDGKIVRLKNYLEPSSNETNTAYLYNSQNYTAWKNGFSSVTTKKNSDGSLTMKLNFKQENMKSNYHNGFMSSFSSADFGDSSGLTVKSLTVGASTLTVTIDKDGILKSYVASSPYSAKFSASFTADEDVKDDNVSIGSGDIVSMEMGISGKTVFNYTFAR